MVSISSVEIRHRSLVVEALRLGGRAAKIFKICMFLMGLQNTLGASVESFVVEALRLGGRAAKIF